MSSFPFHPELFAERGRAMEELHAAGLLWLTSYRSIDLEHELYGLEVCGIRDQETAELAAAVLRKTFPEWRCGGMWERAWWEGDPGWQVVVCRRAHRSSDEDRDEEPNEFEDGQSAEAGESPDAEADGFRLESLGDALRHAGDDEGAVRAYLAASLSVDEASAQPLHPGRRFWLLTLSLKMAAILERRGDRELAGRHRRLAHLELSALVDDPPARSHPIPCRGTPILGGGRRSLTGLQIGFPAGLDPVRFASLIDADTGLVNRRGLEGVLSRQATDDALPHLRRVLVLVDILDQTPIVERFGADGFAEVVHQTARRLLGAFHGPGLVVRWGPGMFAILLAAPGRGAAMSSARFAVATADRLVRRHVRPLPAGRLFHVRVVSGAAFAQGPVSARDRLIPAAELSLQRRRQARTPRA